MKRENLIYFLLVWAFMTVAYTATVLFYFDRSGESILPDLSIFSLIIAAGGFSAWYAIRYMDVGTQSTTQRVISHIVSSTMLALFLTVAFKWIAVSMTATITTQDHQVLVIAKLFIVYFMYALLLLNYYLLKYRDNLTRREQAETQLKAMLQETQLNLLKSQLNPHFIFNSLNSISSLTLTNPTIAREMVIKLSSFLRYSLGNMKQELVTVEEELQNIRLYTDIERTRFGDRLKIIESVDPEILEHRIPILLLQPIIENAIKFSIYDSTEKSEIRLEIGKNDPGFFVTVENNYMENSGYSKGKGIGLRNVRNRLELLYGLDYEFKITSDSGKFHVKIVIKK